MLWPTADMRWKMLWELTKGIYYFWVRGKDTCGTQFILFVERKEDTTISRGSCTGKSSPRCCSILCTDAAIRRFCGCDKQTRIDHYYYMRDCLFARVVLQHLSFLIIYSLCLAIMVSFQSYFFFATFIIAHVLALFHPLPLSILINSSNLTNALDNTHLHASPPNPFFWHIHGDITTTEFYGYHPYRETPIWEFWCLMDKADAAARKSWPQEGTTTRITEFQSWNCTERGSNLYLTLVPREEMTWSMLLEVLMGMWVLWGKHHWSGGFQFLIWTELGKQEAGYGQLVREE